MRVGSTSHRTALILGAGATRGSIRHVLINNKRLKPPLNFDFFKVAETYARAKGAGSADDKRLKRLLRVFKSELPLRRVPSLEEAFSLLYVAKDFPQIYRDRPGRKVRAGESREVDDFLSLLTSILAELDERAPSSAYDRLATVLEDGDTVLTLNYDTCLDSALRRHGWDPRVGYRLVGGATKVKWADGNGGIPAPLDVSLLKLHGSVNWWIRGNDLASVFNKKPVLVTGPRQNNLTGYLRQMVPPIYGKVFTHDHWRKLWQNAFDALCEAEVVVVVGCSIVDTDFHLQGFLRRVVQVRKKSENPVKLLVTADRARIRKRWTSLLGPVVKRHQPYPSFEGLLSKGLKV